MTIWRDIIIENYTGDEVLTAALAGVLAVPEDLVEIKRGGGMWSDAYRCVRAEVWATRGQYRLMVALFVLRDQATLDQLDDRAIFQALADRLGCGVLLPDETVLNLPIYLRFRPDAVLDKVYLDPFGLDEDPPRVEELSRALAAADATATNV